MAERPEDQEAVGTVGTYDEWFGRQLGEQWHTAGDGVYTLIGTPDPEADDASRPVAADAVAGLNDALDALDDLVHGFVAADESPPP